MVIYSYLLFCWGHRETEGVLDLRSGRHRQIISRKLDSEIIGVYEKNGLILELIISVFLIWQHGVLKLRRVQFCHAYFCVRIYCLEGFVRKFLRIHHQELERLILQILKLEFQRFCILAQVWACSTAT